MCEHMRAYTHTYMHACRLYRCLSFPNAMRMPLRSRFKILQTIDALATPTLLTLYALATPTVANLSPLMCGRTI